MQVIDPIREGLERLIGRHQERLAFIVLLACVLGVSLYSWLRNWFAHRLRAFDTAQIDGGFGDQFPAELTIVVDGKRLGTDRGVVWFSEGLMGFSGSAASCVLAAADLAPVSRIFRKRHAETEMPKGTILLRGRPDASIVVNPLSGHAKAFAKRLDRFMDDDEPADAERFWPPLRPFDSTMDVSPGRVQASHNEVERAAPRG